MKEADVKLLFKELEEIKKLLMLNASKLGATQPEIGKVLGKSARQVRRILTKKGK